MAAPHVSGLAALLVSLHPDYPPGRIAAILDISADKIAACPTGVASCPYDDRGWNQYFGYGRIDAARAVKVANVALMPLLPLRAPMAD
jgi:hypothetical protein